MEVPVYREEIDWNEIYKLADIHNLIVITFSAVNKLQGEFKPPSEIYSKMKNKFLLYIQHSTVIENYAEKLINNFKKEKLDHIIIKGYVLKDYYPSPEYRSMSDIDILIKTVLSLINRDDDEVM